MNKAKLVITTFMLVMIATASFGASVILNEYNGVRDDNYLKNNGSDVFWGTILGNGGDWFELVVIEDHLNMAGWTIDVFDNGSLSASLTITTDPIWSGVRSGTIITVSENLADDISYDPCSDDWWINVCANSNGIGTYISASDFSTSHSNTQIIIKDSLSNVVFGPAGEGIKPASGIGSDEVFKLEENPSTSITPWSNYMDGTSSTFGAPNVWEQGAYMQDFSDLRAGICIPEPATLSLFAFGGFFAMLMRRERG